jgi:hypothetical protein
MTWTVLFHDAFDSEFNDLPEDVRDEVLAHANMKELRFDAADGVWRTKRVTTFWVFVIFGDEVQLAKSF